MNKINTHSPPKQNITDTPTDYVNDAMEVDSSTKVNDYKLASKAEKKANKNNQGSNKAKTNNTKGGDFKK